MTNLTLTDASDGPSNADPVDQRGYRGFETGLQSPWWATWAITRTGLTLVVRRKAFWVLLGLALLDFLFIFATFYLVAQLQAGMQIGGMGKFIENLSSLADGSAERYLEFMGAQAIITMLLLAFAGTMLVGDDHRHGGMVYYLSRRISSTQYVLGKLCSICLLVLLVTTLPALVLFFEYGMLQEDYSYFQQNWSYIIGIVGFGLIMGVTLSLILMALGSWIHRTIPLVLSWTALFAFVPAVADVLHSEDFGDHWRLANLWYCMRLVGRSCFGILEDHHRSMMPSVSVTLVVVCVVCAVIIWPRVRAVQVIE